MQQRHVVFLTCFVSLAHGFVAYPPNQRSAMRRFVFSGIVEEMGTVVSVSQSEEMVLWDGSTGEGHEMTIRGKVALLDAYIGCSIAVDGVCLTATALGADDFKLGISPETLRRTTLGERRVGDLVNLERSLRAEDRNSGHYVQGHVDGTGTVVEKWVEGDSLWMRLAPPPELLRFIVEKGYIAVDGTSLTVCDVDSTSFTLMLIEHTQKCIVLPTKDVGDPVNLEVDVMAKYSQRALGDIARLENRIESLERRLKDLETSEAGTDYTGLD